VGLKRADDQRRRRFPLEEFSPKSENGGGTTGRRGEVEGGERKLKAKVEGIIWKGAGGVNGKSEAKSENGITGKRLSQIYKETPKKHRSPKQKTGRTEREDKEQKKNFGERGSSCVSKRGKGPYKKSKLCAWGEDRSKYT